MKEAYKDRCFINLYETGLYANFFPIINGNKFSLHKKILEDRCMFFKKFGFNEDIEIEIEYVDGSKIEEVYINDIFYIIYSDGVVDVNYKSPKSYAKLNIILDYFLCIERYSDSIRKKCKKNLIKLKDIEDIIEKIPSMCIPAYNKEILKYSKIIYQIIEKYNLKDKILKKNSKHPLKTNFNNQMKILNDVDKSYIYRRKEFVENAPLVAVFSLFEYELRNYIQNEPQYFLREKYKKEFEIIGL